jgi:GH15 family glucan-1,4-alpha-glucosidase
LYAVDDGVDLDESTLDHLTGYEDARPVRIGNDAHDQEQHDIWGALLHAVHLHTRSGEFLSGVTWENLERQVECAIERWAEPDRGIWENRGEPRHFTSSKIMCWVALDRGALLAETMGNTTSSIAGERSPTRSRPTCWSTASTNAASSRSPTDHRRSMPRCSSACCWDSSPR